ncbi:MAG TPA: thiamine phosphate synthase [Vicinamibacterales bacterium]|nr:thiamine phosphate synthase [Vicinamibacterales bacterium]
MLVTDRRRAPDPSVPALIARVSAAARSGVDLIQIRERDLGDRELAAVAGDAVAAVAGTAARVLVNDRLDVALRAGAHGVHLRADSLPVVRARRLAPPSFLIGRSVHSPDEAEGVARAGGCDYLLVGTIFASAGKPAGHPVGGTALLAAVAARTTVPILAIGGVHPGNARLVRAAGAAGAAAVGPFMTAPDAAALEACVRAFRAALTPPPGLSTVTAGT